MPSGPARVARRSTTVALARSTTATLSPLPQVTYANLPSGSVQTPSGNAPSSAVSPPIAIDDASVRFSASHTCSTSPSAHVTSALAPSGVNATRNGNRAVASVATTFRSFASTTLTVSSARLPTQTRQIG